MQIPKKPTPPEYPKRCIKEVKVTKPVISIKEIKDLLPNIPEDKIVINAYYDGYHRTGELEVSCNYFIPDSEFLLILEEYKKQRNQYIKDVIEYYKQILEYADYCDKNNISNINGVI